MSIDPSEAAASLEAVASVEERTRQRLGYERAGTTIILWGVLTAIGYLCTYFAPHYADYTWIAVIIVTVAGTFAIQHQRGGPPAARRVGRLIAYGYLAVTVYEHLLLVLLWPMSPRQMAAFFPTLGMLAFVLVGLFFGRFYIYLGILVTAAIVAGYYWAGEWYPLWMALMYGGVLVAAGLWLRRPG